MNKNNIIMILAIGAGGYLAYWYVTKHGPNGAAYDANGNQIAPTWWDSWFGSSPSAPVLAPGQTTGGGSGAGAVGTQQQQNIPGQPASTTTPVLPPAATPKFTDTALQALRDSMYNASGHQTSLNADNWSYFMTQALAGNALTADQFVAAFPNITATDRGGNMTADQFLVAVYKSQHGGAAPGMSGLGMIVRSPSMAPSMAFSNARRGAFTGKGGYIQ